MARAVSFTQASGELRIRNARVVFEPSAYDDNDCPRKNIMLELDDTAKGTVREWEADIDSNKLVSALSQFGMRCKVQTDTVRVWNDGKPETMPTGIRNRHANAVVHLTGVWHTKKQSGLSMQLADLEFIPEPDCKYPF